jgi:hypothetical protein
MNTNLNAIDGDEKALIMGTLLGDGHLQKRVSGSCRLKIAHTTDQKAYVEWKHRKLRRFCEAGLTERSEAKGRTIRFETSSNSALLPFHSLFYERRGESAVGHPRYVKVITEQLIGQLPMNPLVLAVFFMDDGSVRGDCNAGKIATMGFTLQENKNICKYIHSWGVKAQPVLHTRASGQYYISLPAETFPKFTSIIKPIVMEIPSMMYKLGRNQ